MLSILDEATDIARTTFGYESLRPDQSDAIEAVMSGLDTFVILSTGSGKSAVYQIPAMMTNGLVLVFSPLIALMKDQVDKLRRWGIRAARISSDMYDGDVSQILANAQRYKILYVAPERLESAEFLRKIERARVELLVVDEAHVLAHAQQDFRPAYTMIGRIAKRLFNDVPRMALTATADEDVEIDVVRALGMNNYRRVVSAPVRPNLRYEVLRELDDTALWRLVRARGFDQAPGGGIIYAATRQRVEELARRGGIHGMQVEPYHAGMAGGRRTAVQDRFMGGETKFITATNAFGMGVDKADIRLVLHADPPGSIHDYAQESGRAGRDGEPASCILNFTSSGIKSRRFFIKTANAPFGYYDRVWEQVSRQAEVREPFELNTLFVEGILKAYGVNPYDAPYYVRSMLSYLKYVGALMTREDRVVAKLPIVDRRRLLAARSEWPNQIRVRPTHATITTRAAQNDPTYTLIRRGICRKPEFAPVTYYRALRKRESHEISSQELEQKRRRAERRLELLLQFAGTDDKHALLRDIFMARSLAVDSQEGVVQYG